MRAEARTSGGLFPEQLQKAADLLDDAERNRKPIAPLTETFPEISVGDAYRIQVLNANKKAVRGGKLRGHKVGLTAKAMQELFGVFEPDYGRLFADMFLEENSRVQIDRFISPRVEIETAFVLGRPLRGPGVTIGDASQAVESVVPAIEIIDSRIDRWRIKLADTIADNGSSAGVVLGGRPLRLSDLDLQDTEAEMLINGVKVEEGNTSDVLGNPLNALVWLANTLGPAGVVLEPGHVVLPGTCVRAVSVGPATTVAGRFQTLGSVAVEFA